MRKQIALLVVAIALTLSSFNPVFATYPDAPKDFNLLKEKLAKSLVVVKWTGNKKGVAFAGNYNLSREERNLGVNSLLVTNFSNLSEDLNATRSCFAKTRSKDVALEYLGKSYVGTCQMYNSDQADLATVKSSLNLEPLDLYDSYIPSPGQWVVVAHYLEGFGINFATSRVRLVNNTNYILGIDKLDVTLSNGGIVFNSLGNFVGVVTSFGMGTAPTSYLKVHGAPLQCQTELRSAYTITNCPITQDKIWSQLNPGQISQPSATPTPTPVPVRDESAEFIDARNASLDSLNAAKEAIDSYKSYAQVCLAVSEEFPSDIKELYDSTELSANCETLETKVSQLRNKIFALNPNQLRTIDAANRMTDQANLFAEDADSLVAKIQDITDELSGTEELFASIIMSLAPLSEVESEVIEVWDVLIERLAFLPKTSEGVIQKSKAFKSSMVFVEQLRKTLNSRNALLQKLSDLKDPRRLKTMVSQFTTLKVNPAQLLAFERSLVSINRTIPSNVCSRGLQTVLISKSGSCPVGYKKVSTLL
jgi:hypothetical protein